MLKLSVITINFNNAFGLEKTIKSVVEQSFDDFEFIIIDGGSSDSSVDIIKKYADKISLWISEKDSGIFNAQNKGIEKANGEYCLFLNSGDCLVDKNVLKGVFENNFSKDIIYGDLATVDETGKKIHLKMPDRLGVIHMLKDTLWHPVSFIKKEVFSNYGNYDETYKIVSDYEFFVRTVIAQKVSYKHLSIEIAIFDRTGVSSDKLKMSELIQERKRVQNKYFNSFLLFLFRLYSKLRN